MIKTVVITGASGAIGSACAKKFYDEGYNIVIGYLNNSKSAENLLNVFGHKRAVSVCADISSPDGAAHLIEQSIKHFGGVDVLINNAGISESGLFQDVTPNELDRMINTNIKGVFYTSQSALRYMIKNHSGAIVNISSMWGETGASAEVTYSMTKAAVIGLTKALAKEVGPSDIRVNCVTPGLIDTPMNSRYLKEELDSISEDTPLCRMGKSEEVAETVFFLASGSASFITGQIVGVNGGYVI